MYFLPEKLDDYVVAHSQDEPELLQQLTRETYQKILQPIMLSGPYQGRVLSMISKLIRPKSVLDKTFDLVFIDADKPNYVNYFHLIIDKLNPGGIILSDNVLWHGKVIEPVDPKDISTNVVLEFNTLLKEDPRIETVLLPIRDGLTISRKI